MRELALGGHALASFSYSKEFYRQLIMGRFGFMKKAEQKALFDMTHEFLQDAAKKGVSSAYFYLGMINLEGTFVKQN